MTDAARGTAVRSPNPASLQDADAPLIVAVRDLLSGLRAGAADVADLIAAETRMAMRLLVAMVVTAVGAAVLGVLSLAALVTALAAELIARGMTTSLAIVVTALLCAAGSTLLGFQLRRLSRRVLFGYSCSHLRGEY